MKVEKETGKAKHKIWNLDNKLNIKQHFKTIENDDIATGDHQISI